MLKPDDKKTIITLLVILVLFSLILLNNYVLLLRKVHSSLRSYCDFRGHTQIIKKTDKSGLCVNRFGQAINVVKQNGQWSLESK